MLYEKWTDGSDVYLLLLFQPCDSHYLQHERLIWCWGQIWVRVSKGTVKTRNDRKLCRKECSSGNTHPCESWENSVIITMNILRRWHICKVCAAPVTCHCLTKELDTERADTWAFTSLPLGSLCHPVFWQSSSSLCHAVLLMINYLTQMAWNAATPSSQTGNAWVATLSVSIFGLTLWVQKT